MGGGQGLKRTGTLASMQPGTLDVIDELIKTKVALTNVERSKTDYNFQIASKVNF